MNMIYAFHANKLLRKGEEGTGVTVNVPLNTYLYWDGLNYWERKNSKVQSEEVLPDDVPSIYKLILLLHE